MQRATFTVSVFVLLYQYEDQYKKKKNLVAEEVRVTEGHIYGTLTPERRGPRHNRYAVALHPAVATPLTHLYLHSALMEP